MGQIDNLNRGEIADLIRRVRALENRTTLNNAAIGRSGMEVYDSGEINVSNGTLRVNGFATITGTFQVAGGSTFTGQVAISGPLAISGNTSVSGQFTVTGPTRLNGQTDIGGNTSMTGDLAVKGPLTVTGATKLDGKTDIGGNTTVTGDLGVKGPLDVTGTMDIKGKSTLQNDLTVRNGGKITAGGMTLDPSSSGGSIQFQNGAYLISNSGVTALSSGGDASIDLSSTLAQIRGARVSLNGPLSNPNHATASSDTKPNVYMDANGNIKRILPG